MLEISGNIWELVENNNYAAIVITTNGNIKFNGNAIMGTGIALQAASRFPDLRKRLGGHLKVNGNHARAWESNSIWANYKLITMPVKHNWWEKADISLIERSCKEIVNISDALEFNSVLMPRPGCGSGGLKWEQVKVAIEPLLDSRFVVVDYEQGM